MDKDKKSFTQLLFDADIAQVYLMKWLIDVLLNLAFQI